MHTYYGRIQLFFFFPHVNQEHSLKGKGDGDWREKKGKQEKEKTVSEMIMSRAALPPQQLQMEHRVD